MAMMSLQSLTVIMMRMINKKNLITIVFNFVTYCQLPHENAFKLRVALYIMPLCISLEIKNLLYSLPIQQYCKSL